MTKTSENLELKKSLKIGAVCILTYTISYYMRNILSITAPEMLDTNQFTKEFIASLSSVYMLLYACGQLINGIIGDIVKPKYMISLGLCLAGVSLAVFPIFITPAVGFMSFALLGFGFSMLRGPIVKIVSENTCPGHARICCVFLSVSCYAGPFIASLLALFMNWKNVFTVSGIIAFIMAAASFISLSVLEASGLIKPMTVKKNEQIKSPKNIFSVFTLKNFTVYLLIGMVIEISSSAISFWLPTYLNEYLGFSTGASGIVFSIISLIKSIGPFLCLILFKSFGENDMRMMRSMFILSAVFFAGMCVINNPFINVILLIAALLSGCCSSGVMWSIYIPGLAKSGRVSSANGILDCSGYAASAIATSGFALFMNLAGWTGTILLWAAISILGAVVTLFGKKSDFSDE